MRRIERERDESREEMLNEDGRGIEWMKNFEWRRRDNMWGGIIANLLIGY
jgi:hypothetical protein